MNDEVIPCESRSTDISLLAADCLTAEESQNLKLHLATCAVCRERFEQLVGVCESLRSQRASLSGIDVSGIVARAMATVSDESRSEASVTRPVIIRQQGSRTQQRRRWMMSACAAGVIGIVGGLVWRSFATSKALPDTNNLARDLLRPVETRVVEPEKTSSPTHQIKPTPNRWPTLLELRQAVAQSDEAFEALLAQKSNVFASVSLNPRFSEEPF